MVQKKYSELPQEAIQSTSIIPFENGSGLTKRDTALAMSAIAPGGFITYVSAEADLPPLLGGFHQLEQDKNYHFTEAFQLANPILFPAAWTGRIVKTFFSTQVLDYTGTTPMFQTLNIDGIIDSISDPGGGAITVTTSTPHGLINGQFVNITGTTSYNQNALVISNASGSVFDVQIAFVVDEAGAFNTGFGSILFVDFDTVSANTAEFMDLTSAGIPGTVIGFNVFLAAGFKGMGIIRNAVNILSFNCIFGSITSGLTLENCATAALSVTSFADLGGVAGVTALTITGALTNRITVLNSEFLMGESTQFPVRIDSSVTTANELLFGSSPDNEVATDYFDTSAGGLDQTDPQVNSDNNGKRANSMFSGGFFYNADTVPATTTVQDGVFGPLNLSDFSGVTAFAENERFNVSDADEGVLEYTGLIPKTVTLISILSMNNSGGSQNYNLRFAIDRGAGFVAMPTALERLQNISSTFRDSSLNQEVIVNTGDKIRIEIEGISHTVSINVLFVSLDIKG